MLILIFVLTSVFIASGKPATDTGKFAIFPPLPILVINTSNALCKEQSELYTTNLKNFTLWASEIWDATAKDTTGIMRGNMYNFGNFGQCLSARAPFPTQYCLVTIRANISAVYRSGDPTSIWHSPYEHAVKVLYPKPEDLTQERRDILKLGWCVPASCHPLDLQTHLQSFIDDLDLPLKALGTSYSAEISETDCQTAESNEVELLSILSFILVTILLVLLVVAAAFYEFLLGNHLKNMTKTRKHLLSRLLLCFSAEENWNSLWKIGSRNPSLAVVDGVKACTILIIIISHECVSVGYVPPSVNADAIEMLYRNSFFDLIINIISLVDVFFLVSGILASYIILRQLSRGISPLNLICTRYMRSTPSLAYVILFYVSILRHTGSGPLWNQIVGREAEDCKANWWTNLMYLNNYINPNHMCIVQSWFLTCIFHYYILTIFMCLLIKKKEVLGVISLLSATVISIAVLFVLVFNNSLPPYLRVTPQVVREIKMNSEFLTVYIASHTRATPYLIGAIAGYCFYKDRSQIKEEPKKILKKIDLNAAVFWGSTCLVVASYCSSILFINPVYKYSPTESAFYSTLSRIAMSLGTTGVIYSAGKWKPWFIYRFLCSYPFTIMSKLALGAYLVHMIFQFREVGMVQSSQFFSIIDLIGKGALNLFGAYIVAFIVYILVEEPFRRVFQVLTSFTPNAITTRVQKENSRVSSVTPAVVSVSPHSFVKVSE